MTQKNENCAGQDELNEIAIKVRLLERDVELVNSISERLGTSIEKIQEMSTSLVKMISLHDQKHQQHEKAESELKEDIKEIYTRIAAVSTEIHDRIDQVERHISSRIDALRSDLIAHKKEDVKKPEEVDLAKKISDIEQWRWMLIGAIAVSAWVIGEANIIGKLFK